MNLQKKLLVSSIALAMVSGLTACGGGSKGDSGSVNNVQMSGAVVDDYIAFSRIYVDINNNGKFDPSFEPYATTDVNGFFSKGKSGDDYCADPKDPSYRYCLNIPANYTNNAVIRVENGRDTLTTQLYESAMSLRTTGATDNLRVTALSTTSEVLENEELIKKAAQQLINPATNQPYTEDEINDIKQKYATYLAGFLGSASASSLNQPRSYSTRAISLKDLSKIDPLNFGEGKLDEQDRAFKLAIQVHKIAEAIARAIVTDSSGNYVNDTHGNPIKEKDVLPQVYLAFMLHAPTGVTTNDLFKDITFLSGAIDDAAKLAKVFHPSLPSNSIGTNEKAKITALTKYLNCTLANSGDTAIDPTTLPTDYKSGASCSSILASDSTNNARRKLYSAELGTKAVIKKLKTNEDVGSQLDEAKIPSESTTTFDVTQNDFDVALEVVTDNKPDSSLNASTLDINDDLDQLLNTQDPKILDLSGGDTSDEIAARFTSNNKVILCQNGDKYIGDYRVDPDKNYLMYVEYAGVSATIKKLDPNNSTCVNENGGTTAPEKCYAASYPNLERQNDSDPLFLTKYVVKSSGDDVIKPLSGLSATQQQCLTN